LVKRIIASPLIATSVITQADMIKRLLQDKGYEVEFKNTITIHDMAKEENKAFLWFTLATIRFLGDAVWPYIACKKPKAVYVTIEGVPQKSNILNSNLPRLSFIANSKFTADCLTQAGLKVIDVVHHAIDYEKCRSLKKDSLTLRQKWEAEFGDRVKFLYLGRNDPRKGLDLLGKAVGILNEEHKNEFVVLLVSEGDVAGLTDQSNVMKVAQCGALMYDDVLRIMGAPDYFVFPSMCEGFGVPLLEANAMGIPAVHAWIPPLEEFSSKDFNFVFGYQGTEIVNQGHAQWWVFHRYRAEMLAEMMGHAINIFRKSKKEYQEYCAKALEHSKAWDYRKIYPKLLRHLNVG